MLLLKIIIFALGITHFQFLRYLIVFKEKKFELIDGYEARKKVGSRTDADAIRLGKVALSRRWLLVLFVLLMIFT